MSFLPFGGVAAAGPDPFTVVPDLVPADGTMYTTASRGDEPKVPFEGVLADLIQSPGEGAINSPGEAEVEGKVPAEPKAERDVPTDLTGLLLGAVNAKLRDDERPDADLAPEHLRDTATVEGAGRDAAAQRTDGLPLTETGSGESREEGVYRISLPPDLLGGTGQHDRDALALTDTAVKSTGEAASAEAAARLEALPVDPSKLHPELRARLQRVIERMQAEFGYDVKLTEGFRTPERQAQLYAQGRTIPGPVVTWTQESAHTQGLAADVIIDGSYDNPTAYQRFAQIAQQEGLKSLAPLDPGHVELDAEGLGLPRNGSSVTITGVRADVARPAAVAQITPVAEVGRTAAMAQVAAIAAPDQVARPDAVAPVARVATPGADVQLALGGERGAMGSEGNPDGGAGLSTEVMPDRQLASAEERATREHHTFEPRMSDSNSDAGIRGEVASRTTPSALTPTTESGPQNASFPRIDAPVAGSEAMERAQRVRELLEAQRRPVQQMTLAVDAGTPEEALMKVSLKDGRVSTSIGIRDPFAAERLAAESAALRSSLVRQGVEPGAIDVRAMLPLLDSDAGFSTRREGQQPFTPGLGEHLDGNRREDADGNARSRSYWETINRDRDQLFGPRGGKR